MDGCWDHVGIGARDENDHRPKDFPETAKVLRSWQVTEFIYHESAETYSMGTKQLNDKSGGICHRGTHCKGSKRLEL